MHFFYLIHNRNLHNFLLTSLFIIDFHAVNFPQKRVCYLVIYLALVHFINECNCEKKRKWAISEKKKKQGIEDIIF